MSPKYFILKAVIFLFVLISCVPNVMSQPSALKNEPKSTVRHFDENDRPLSKSQFVREEATNKFATIYLLGSDGYTARKKLILWPRPQSFIGSPAFLSKIRGLNKEKFDLRKKDGKIYLINFQLKSRKEFDRMNTFLNRMHVSYGDKGLVVIGIHNIERSLLRQLQKPYAFKYTLVADPTRSFAYNHNVWLHPSNYLIGIEKTNLLSGDVDETWDFELIETEIRKELGLVETEISTSGESVPTDSVPTALADFGFEPFDERTTHLKSTKLSWELTDIQGNKIKFTDFRGKKVVINFWFKACKPCLMEMPELNKLKEEYHSKGVEFIAISLDSKEQILNFLAKKKFDFTHISDVGVSRRNKISSFPTNIVLDETGEVIFARSGFSPMFLLMLEKLL